MRNELFDHLIKLRTKEMKSEGRPNWQRMAAMIDQWEIEEHYVSDSAFDKMVVSKLKQQSATFSESNWNKLEKEIDRRRTIRQRIIMLQISSAAVFVLLAMLTFQLYPYFNTQEFSGEKIAKDNPSRNEVVPKTLTPENDLVESEPILAKSQVVSSEIRPPDTFQGSGSGVSGQPGPSEDTGSGINYLAGLTISRMTEMGRSRIFSPASYFSELEQSEEVLAVSVVVSYFELMKAQLPGDFFHLSGSNDIARLTQNRNDNKISGELQEPQNSPAIHEHINQKTAKPDILLAGYYSPAIHFIQSPFDQVFQEPGYSLNQLDDGIGVMAGTRYKKLGLDIGVEYGSLEYAPRKIEEDIDEGKSIYLKKIALHTLKVPIHISMELFRNKLWEIYCKTGLSVKTILKAEYNMEEQSNGLAYLIKDLKTNPAYAHSLYGKKTFESGLMDEGNVVKNVSSSADFGIGIKRQIARDTYAFIEPMMQIDLAGNGFGPNQDKIHNLHMKAGIFVDIN